MCLAISPKFISLFLSNVFTSLYCSFVITPSKKNVIDLSSTSIYQYIKLLHFFSFFIFLLICKYYCNFYIFLQQLSSLLFHRYLCYYSKYIFSASIYNIILYKFIFYNNVKYNIIIESNLKVYYQDSFIQN